MAEFAYNNAKIASTGYTPFELNCRYHPRVFYKEDLNSYLQSKTAEELSSKLWNLMAAYQQNLYHAQKLQKRAYNKGVKPQSYASGNKVWLSSKHLKTKRNCKLEAKFFGHFRVLHPVSKQAYKLELHKRLRIHNAFHVSMLKQDITKKGKWMIRSWILSLRLAMIKNLRLMAFETVRSMLRSQKVNYKGFTIWSRGKATLRRRIPGSLHQQSSTVENLSPPTIKTIQKSRQQYLPPLIRPRRWLGHLLHPGQRPLQTF